MSEQFPRDNDKPQNRRSRSGWIASSAPAPRRLPRSEKNRRQSRWIAPAWLFLGILVGLIGFAAYNALIAKSPAAAVDAVAMREAARDGLLEAIATLEARAGQQQPAAQEPQAPQVVASNAFTVRAANRQGNPDAKVTIYEFSDFQ